MNTEPSGEGTPVEGLVDTPAEQDATAEAAAKAAAKAAKKRKKKKKKKSLMVDQWGRDSFPASDPPGNY